MATWRSVITHNDARKRAVHAGDADCDIGRLYNVLVAQQAVDTCDTDVIQSLDFVVCKLCEGKSSAKRCTMASGLAQAVTQSHGCLLGDWQVGRASAQDTCNRFLP